MIRHTFLEPEFVDHIPDNTVPGRLYVSMVHATAIHRCCCGCGEEVVTPLSPTDWRLEFDGVNLSIWPSIGNWQSSCQSHYVVREGRVIEAPPLPRAEIEAEWARDKLAKAAHYASIASSEPEPEAKARGIRTRIALLWRRLTTPFG